MTMLGGICPVCYDDLYYTADVTHTTTEKGLKVGCCNEECSFEGIEWARLHFDRLTDLEGKEITYTYTEEDDADK